jgi:hypothetical protein
MQRSGGHVPKCMLAMRCRMLGATISLAARSASETHRTLESAGQGGRTLQRVASRQTTSMSPLRM